MLQLPLLYSAMRKLPLNRLISRREDFRARHRRFYPISIRIGSTLLLGRWLCHSHVLSPKQWQNYRQNELNAEYNCKTEMKSIQNAPHDVPLKIWNDIWSCSSVRSLGPFCPLCSSRAPATNTDRRSSDEPCGEVCVNYGPLSDGRAICFGLLWFQQKSLGLSLEKLCLLSLPLDGNGGCERPMFANARSMPSRSI